MKLLRLQVHHVAGAKDVEFDVSGHSLYLIGGRNGSGKTSAIKALLMALCGRDELRKEWPAIPLQSGEDEGYVHVHLSGDTEMQDDKGFVAELHFTRRRDGSVKEEFVLKDSDGDPAPEPRTLLQRLYSMRMFDPTAFDRLRPKEQRAELARLFPQLDFSEQDTKLQRLYNERTDVNREGKALKARVESIPDNGDVPDEEVVVADLLVEMTRREMINKTNRAENHKLTELQRQARQAHDTQQQRENLLEGLKARVSQAEQSLEDARVACETAIKNLEAQEKKCEGICDENTDEIAERIAQSQEINDKVRQKKLKREGEMKLRQLRSQSESLSDLMKEIEQSKVCALREAKLPVEGLGVDSEGLTFDGLPFEQAPKSKRFLVGCMIGMSGERPKLPLLVCEHGDGLDWETLEEFDRMLRERDWQAVIEVCSKSESDDEHCQVIMEGGQVKRTRKAGVK